MTLADGGRRYLGWAQVLGLVPYGLGFSPDGSLVVLGYAGARLAGMIRADLPDPPLAGTGGPVSRILAGGWKGLGVSAAAVAGFGPDRLAGPATAEVSAAVGEARLDLLDAVRVEDGLFWSYLAEGPAGGTPVQPPPADLAARMGPVLASRQELAASLAAAGGRDAEEMAAATARARQRLASLTADGGEPLAVEAGTAAVRRAVDACRAGGTAGGPAELAWLSVALGNRWVFQEATARMDPDHRQAHERLWRALTVLAAPGYVPGPASLLALSALQSGNGVLANIALDRALSDARAPGTAPGRPLAAMLRDAADRGLLPPRYAPTVTPAQVAEVRAGRIGPAAAAAEALEPGPG